MKRYFDWVKFTSEAKRFYTMGTVHGWGMRDMAKDIGVSPATLQRVTVGKKCSLDVAVKICDWWGGDLSEYVVRREVKPRRRKP